MDEMRNVTVTVLLTVVTTLCAAVGYLYRRIEHLTEELVICRTKRAELESRLYDVEQY